MVCMQPAHFTRSRNNFSHLVHGVHSRVGYFVHAFLSPGGGVAQTSKARNPWSDLFYFTITYTMFMVHVSIVMHFLCKDNKRHVAWHLMNSVSNNKRNEKNESAQIQLCTWKQMQPLSSVWHLQRQQSIRIHPFAIRNKVIRTQQKWIKRCRILIWEIKKQIRLKLKPTMPISLEPKRLDNIVQNVQPVFISHSYWRGETQPTIFSFFDFPFLWANCILAAVADQWPPTWASPLFVIFTVFRFLFSTSDRCA